MTRFRHRNFSTKNLFLLVLASSISCWLYLTFFRVEQYGVVKIHRNGGTEGKQIICPATISFADNSTILFAIQKSSKAPTIDFAIVIEGGLIPSRIETESYEFCESKVVSSFALIQGSRRLRFRLIFGDEFIVHLDGAELVLQKGDILFISYDGDTQRKPGRRLIERIEKSPGFRVSRNILTDWLQEFRGLKGVRGEWH